MPRTNLASQHPALYRAAVAMAEEADTAARDAGLAAGFVELVKVRVSQLNSCAFCLRAHSADALSAGEPPARLAVLPAWRETSYFDPAEREALALAERVALLGSAPHEAEAGGAYLTPAQASAVGWVAVATGTFNRIAVTSHYRVAPERA